jgi:hypothetical protein
MNHELHGTERMTANCLPEELLGQVVLGQNRLTDDQMAHLSDCDACRAALREIRMVAGLSAEPSRLDPVLVKKVLQAVEQEVNAHAGGFRWVGAVAAAVLIVAVLALVFSVPTDPPSPVPAPPALSAPGLYAFGGPDHEMATATAPGPDDSVLIAGTVTGEGTDLFVTRLARDRSVAWQTRIAHSDDQYVYSMSPMRGGYVLVGFTKSKAREREDHLITAIAEDGTLLWQKEFGGVGFERLMSVDRLSDGDLIAVGISMSQKYKPDPTVAATERTSHPGMGVFVTNVVRFSPDGDLRWYRAIDGSLDRRGEYEREGHAPQPALSVDAKGRVLVASVANRFGPTTDGWLIAMTGDGAIQWQRVIHAEGRDRLVSITGLDDGSVVAVGMTGRTGADGQQLSPWVVKADTDGTVAWQKRLEMEGPGYSAGVTALPGSEFIVTGMSHEPTGAVATVSRMDCDGVELSSDAYRLPPSHSFVHIGVVNPHGGQRVAIAGQVRSDARGVDGALVEWSTTGHPSGASREAGPSGLALRMDSEPVDTPLVGAVLEVEQFTDASSTPGSLELLQIGREIDSE